MSRGLTVSGFYLVGSLYWRFGVSCGERREVNYMCMLLIN
jgi:hypothetical protein